MADTQRTERDALGEKQVPAEAYYGVQTQRAMENFPISGLRAHRALIRATGLIKRAAAEANVELGELDQRIGEAIVQAAQEVADGRWDHQFVVDVFQAGAGTSHNMNANEVIANRAAEILGGGKGDYSLVHPNDQVNMSQSSNDFFPAAIRLAALLLVQPLLSALNSLAEALLAKGAEFDDIVKVGRTHLQDAVPIRLGQEFAAYAASVRRDMGRIARAANSLRDINLGATAVGTGMGAHPRYQETVVQKLRLLTGLQLRPAANLVEVTQSMTDMAELSGALRLLALDLIRIANDLRLLSSGPRAGLGEIALPPVQPGSSIMPGKVNPSVPEMLNMVCFQVVGNDVAVALACQAGQLEHNVMTPVIAHNLLQSLDILRNAAAVFTMRCVAGIVANRERCRALAEESMALATVLTPYVGYEAAVGVAQEAMASGRRVRDIVAERGLLSQEELAEVFDLRAMTEPRRRAP